jgi:hypothetical protein
MTSFKIRERATKLGENVWANPRTVIAFLTVIGCFSFLFVPIFHAIPAANKDIIQLAAGSILTSLATVIGFYFGSSKSAADQQKTMLDNIATTPPAQPAA